MIEIQGSREYAYAELENTESIDDEIEELSKECTINDENEITHFIKRNGKILPYIHEITPLINEYFPNYEKNIQFCKDPDFSTLNFLMIYIECNTYENDRETLKRLKDEPVYMSKFSKKN